MQRPGLGREFTSAIEAATSRIQRSPERFRITVDEFRRVLVRRFPFEIFFDFDDERAVIYMIFHTSQQPDKWRERLRLP
jgi:plasmid stabilization system protein ParE